jgi:hypothetical protein
MKRITLKATYPFEVRVSVVRASAQDERLIVHICEHRHEQLRIHSAEERRMESLKQHRLLQV